jgi:hypothetical protein
VQAAAAHAFVHGASIGALGTAVLTVGTAVAVARFLPAFRSARTWPAQGAKDRVIS